MPVSTMLQTRPVLSSACGPRAAAKTSATCPAMPRRGSAATSALSFEASGTAKRSFSGLSRCPARSDLSPVRRSPCAAASSRPSVAASELPPPAPCPPAPSPELFVGVDFGTSESGFAYVRPGEEAGVRLHQNWPKQPKGAVGPKTRTAILYKLDEQGKATTPVESWGWKAYDTWYSLSAEERPHYAYLENFKLLLHDGQGQGPLDTVCPLPPNLTPTQVAADFLTELKRYALKYFRDQGVSVRPEAVRWCVTLPAMWTEADKKRVRDAAERTGMGCSPVPLSLLLTLEPEAAILAVAAMQTKASAAAASETELKLQNAQGTSTARPAKARLSPEDVVLVLDCGGGTVDLTLARVYGTGRRTRMEEEAVGRGVLAGSRFVDAAASSLLCTLVGEEPWDEWRKSHPDEWAQLEERWEAAKRTFKGPDAEEVQLVLQQGLLNTVGRNKLQNLPVIDDPSGDGSSYLFRVDMASTPERLLLPAPALEALVFKPVVDQIMREAKEMLDNGHRGGAPVTRVLLVGGFAASPYLQQRVKEELGPLLAAEPGPAHSEAAAAALGGGGGKATGASKGKVLIPAKPAAAVVVGAVLFGQQPESFTARRCRRTYAIGVARPWTAEDAVSAATHSYPAKTSPESGTYYADGALLPYVVVGQRVEVDQVVKHTFSPLRRTDTSVRFELFSSASPCPRYACEPGCRRVGYVELELPPGWSNGLASARDYKLQAELRFGCSELTVTATDPRTGNVEACKGVWDGELEGQQDEGEGKEAGEA